MSFSEIRLRSPSCGGLMPRTRRSFSEGRDPPRLYELRRTESKTRRSLGEGGPVPTFPGHALIASSFEGLATRGGEPAYVGSQTVRQRVIILVFHAPAVSEHGRQG